MLVLGLESSCDETAAAVVKDGRQVLSDVVSSQAESVHARFGGVVPELASRAHVVHAVPVVDKALSDANLSLGDIDGIAVTQGPGLVGALLVALQTGKALAYAAQKPFIGVHHLEGHLSAIYLEDEAPPFPNIALIVSGGHTSLVRVEGHGQVLELGSTRDDAAGEAFDKVAKLLGLGYPGGVQIDRLSKLGDPSAIPFPRPMTKASTGLDFSYSGLKTAALNRVQSHGAPSESELPDFCASFQYAVVEALVRKTVSALEQTKIKHVQICGGVAANSALRSQLKEACSSRGVTLYTPSIKHCTDNAAMIASAGYFRLKRGERSDFDINVDSSLPLEGPTK